MVDFRTNYARDIASRVHTTYGSQIEVFENVIPMSVKAAETSAEAVSYTHLDVYKRQILYWFRFSVSITHLKG